MAVKKQWYQIQTPEMFDNKVVGETPIIDVRKVGRRLIEVNLMELEKNYRRFFVKLKFRITDNKDGVLQTEFVGHDSMNERIYKMVQRRSRRVDSLHGVITKDGKTVRLKTVFILDNRVNTTIKKAARKKSIELLDGAAKKETLETMIKSIISGKTGEDIRKEISKVYPCSDLEIRSSEILADSK